MMNTETETRIDRRLVKRIALAVIILGLIAVIAGIFVFRNVLRPGQQQRVINMVPFMDIFMYRPPENESLPTPLPATSAISPDDLLNFTLEPSSNPIPTTSGVSNTTEPETLPTLAP